MWGLAMASTMRSVMALASMRSLGGRRHHQVEAAERVLVLVEAPSSRMSTSMPVRMRNGASASFSAAISSSWASRRSRFRPCATVSRGEWSVMTTYSWPSAMALRAMASIGGAAVGPVGVHVAVAPERGPDGLPSSSSSGMTVDASSLRWYSGTRPRAASAMAVPVESPIPSSSVRVPSAARRATSSSPSSRTMTAGLLERPRLLRRLEAPVEQVDDPVEGLGRRQRLDGVDVDGGRKAIGGGLPTTSTVPGWKFGFVGLPNASKSSLPSNAFAGGGAPRRPTPSPPPTPTWAWPR